MTSHFFKGLGETVLGIFKNSKKAFYVPISGQSQSLEVIFLDRHTDVDISGKPYGAPKPIVWFKTGLIDPQYQDKITVEGQDYLIVEIKPNGHELTELILQEVTNDSC